MFRKLLAAGGIAILATSVALADPPEGKGKPDKGGDDGGGDGGAFVPAWIHTENLGGNNGFGIVLANEGFTTSRVVGPSDFRVEDMAHDASRDRVLIKDDRSIVELRYEVTASGSVNQLGASRWYERITPDQSDDTQTGTCVGLSDLGPAVYGYLERSRDASGSLVPTDAGLNVRDANGANETVLANGEYLTCTYLPGSDTIVASQWDNVADVSRVVTIDAQGAVSPLVDVPNRVYRIDVAENGGNYRFLITWSPVNAEMTVSEWDGVQAFSSATTVATGAESASYLCDTGGDGWPKGVLYRERTKNSWRWIEDTNTRRQIGGRKGTWLQLQQVC